MDTTSLILSVIREKCGYAPPERLYEDIHTWADWWRGTSPAFHVFTEHTGGMAVRRELYRMRMAKKVCEDWAAILMNDRTRLMTDKTEINRVLLGNRFGVDGILTGDGFWERINALTEVAFALGTAGVRAVFSGIRTDRDGFLEGADGMRLSYLSAERIFPLETENGEIVSCAFAGDVRADGKDGKPCIGLEYHRREKRGGGYVWHIENEVYDMDGHRQTTPRGICCAFYAPRPLFALLRPNLVNPDTVINGGFGASGMGISVFADAIDNLKGIDLAYNNFCRDLYLGGKKVFMNQQLVAEDRYGNRVAPDDVAQQLFMTVGDGDLSADTMIVEHNPMLRTDENCRAVQAQLDYLSFKVGFGTRHYRFTDDDTVTATEYAGERQDMLAHASKHAIRCERFLTALVGIAYYYATVLRGISLPPLGCVSVDFDDSFFIDPTAERERDLREVAAGLLSPWEYRMKYYGESAEAARAMILSMQGGAKEQNLKGVITDGR